MAVRKNDPWRDEFYKRTGKRIREWRRQRNLTAETLGHLIGVSESVMISMELGRQSIASHYLWRMCVVLGTAPSDLMPAAKPAVANR